MLLPDLHFVTSGLVLAPSEGSFSRSVQSRPTFKSDVRKNEPKQNYTFRIGMSIKAIKRYTLCFVPLIPRQVGIKDYNFEFVTETKRNTFLKTIFSYI